MIKRNELKVAEDNGRYLIYSNLKSTMNSQERELLELKLEVERLRMEMKTFVEENNELKMLVDLYESGQMLATPTVITLPELPI
jgi:regulator of replication initiation timing